jgi:hypothetical protein
MRVRPRFFDSVRLAAGRWKKAPAVNSGLAAALLAGAVAGMPYSVFGDAAPPPRAGIPAPSTVRMAELIKKIANEGNPLQNPFRAREQIAIYRGQLDAATSDRERVFILMRLGQDLLETGDCEGALEQFTRVEQIFAAQNVPIDDKLGTQLMINKALCYLRMGEQENCCANHNPDSCIFPIHGDGVHTRTRGSRAAIAVLTDMLTKHPRDLRAKWLLNIAYSTLGEYPAKVPPSLLIDPKCFASDYDIKPFPDVAAAVGLDVDSLAGGVVLEDFDGDGFLDLMVSAWGAHDQMRFFHNNGDGTFTERTEQAGLIGETGGLSMISCDYNNDGKVDVLVMRGAWLSSEGHYPMSLLRNNGDGTFTDVTEKAGLMRFFPSQAAVWFDFDGDGWLDLFIGNESVGGDNKPCQLYHNNHDGTFTECAAVCGLDKVGFFKGAVSADYNRDGRPDLFLSRRDGPPMLFRNDGPGGPYSVPRGGWHFTDVSEEANIIDPGQSFGCAFFDYDNDGWPDILVCGYGLQDVGDVAADYLHLPTSGQKAHLYHNNGDGSFTDVSRQMGMNKIIQTMGINYGDLDNDGFIDVYCGTGDPSFSMLIPNRMFRNDGGQRFQEVTTSGGFGQLQKGHGIAFGDINNDGEQDIYSVVGGAVEADHFHHQLFANPGHGNHWLKLKLEGVQTNRVAIGAQLKVFIRENGRERMIFRTVGSGASFGATTYRQEIGIGKADTVDRVEIFWPVTGQTQVIKGLAINQAYAIREGDDRAELMHMKSFAWPVPPAAPHIIAKAPAISAALSPNS